MEGLKKMGTQTSATVQTCFTVVLIQHFFGSAEGIHKSNGVERRVSTNDYGKEPSAWSSSYVQDAMKGRKGVARTEWPGVNGYYKQFVNQYPEYVSNSTFKRLTSAPTGENRNGYKFLGVCINYEQLNPNITGTFLGPFTCPLPFEPDQHTFCCGNDYAEYCCEPKVNKISLIVGPVIVVPLCLFVLSVCFWSCCCKKKEPKEDEEAINGKDTSAPPEEVKVASGAPTILDEPQYQTNYTGRPNVIPENPTSTTSLNSEYDNGYGSGHLNETKPLDPSHPTSKNESQREKEGEGAEEKERTGRSQGGQNDSKVATFSLSEGSLSEHQIL